MDADDEKSMGIEDVEAATSKSDVAGGRMSITEEDVANASDGLSCCEDDDDEDDDLSEDEEDEDYDIYYGGDNLDLDDGRGGVGVGSGSQFNNNDDPEYFGYECLSVAQIKDLLAENVASVCATIQVRDEIRFLQK